LTTDTSYRQLDFVELTCQKFLKLSNTKKTHLMGLSVWGL
jgi:hypothetical protein